MIGKYLKLKLNFGVIYFLMSQLTLGDILSNLNIGIKSHDELENDLDSIEEIESSLAKLKPIDRKFYNDYFIKNYTFDEIAALENVSQPAISRRYKRFKQRMSIEFKKRHIDEKYLENLEVFN